MYFIYFYTYLTHILTWIRNDCRLWHNNDSTSILIVSIRKEYIYVL